MRLLGQNDIGLTAESAESMCKKCRVPSLSAISKRGNYTSRNMVKESPQGQSSTQQLHDNKTTIDPPPLYLKNCNSKYTTVPLKGTNAFTSQLDRNSNCDSIYVRFDSKTFVDNNLCAEFNKDAKLESGEKSDVFVAADSNDSRSSKVIIVIQRCLYLLITFLLIFCISFLFIRFFNK